MIHDEEDDDNGDCSLVFPFQLSLCDNKATSLSLHR